jgi:uncharacterized protein (UPF0332 family)
MAYDMRPGQGNTLFMSVSEHLHKAQTFLYDATLCADHGRYDSAVSRAYYAMFRAAMALMEHYGYIRPSWNHGRLERLLSERMIADRALLAQGDVEALHNAYTLRIVADYGTRQLVAPDTQEILALASRFVHQVEGLINDATQPERKDIGQ